MRAFHVVAPGALELHDIPDDIWRFICDNGFLGMLISKQHGGLGFSAQAQSLILGKISSRSADGVTIVMGHEYSETITDQNPAGGWTDTTGAENADKCAWTFGGSLITFSNSTQWKIQGNWSNAAYGTGRSYLGAGSGCIDGN